MKHWREASIVYLRICAIFVDQRSNTHTACESNGTIENIHQTVPIKQSLQGYQIHSWWLKWYQSPMSSSTSKEYINWKDNYSLISESMESKVAYDPN